jgi:hypothetical protein
MSKHTPGPWTVRWNPVTVCVLDGDGNYITENVRQLPNQEANVLLIAAAPDLLAAAKLAVLHFKRNKATGDFQGDDEHEAWTALDDAISKAEGGVV